MSLVDAIITCCLLAAYQLRQFMVLRLYRPYHASAREKLLNVVYSSYHWLAGDDPGLVPC